ncbi:unnamed protein product [Mytilus coruscus]|uniref:Uncharacterized protein n=1 Tax=Mytilus coruscus TaxID=42192 RepID=A0A6J8AHP0_MYTCO|nr:unnamed protein product [Mytilus coruscus]
MDDIANPYSSDEYGTEAEESRKANSTKWLKSSNVSLSHLQQVKPVSVYNFGLANKKDLKATNLTSQRSNSFTNLVAEPVIQSVSSQKTAWGSNGSIPDLLKVNTKASQRPSSAKISARKHHPPIGKKQRPQSAKEEVVQRSPGIAVKGAKFDPTGRPPKAYSATTGWIGPPAGMKFSDSNQDLLKSNMARKTPPPPAGTPRLHIDIDLQSNTNEDVANSPRLRYTHAESPRTPTPPHVPPAPIHLMLPTMYDEEDEDEDELDTERLLTMAEEHIHADKKSESINDFIEKVSSANHCVNDLPGYTYTHVTSPTSKESKLEIHTYGDSEVVSWEKEDVNDSYDFSGSEYFGQITNTPRSEIDSYQPHPLEKVSVKFSEDRNVTIDITPRNAGHKVSELSRKKPEKILESEELQSVLSVSSANTQEVPVSSRNKTVSLTEMKHETKTVRTLTNNKSYTRSEKPKNENLEFSFNSHDNNRCEKSFSNRPASASTNRPTTPLSSVTVAYCDLDNAKKRKRYRGLKSEKDVVTLVQQMQVSDSDEEKPQEVITPDKLEPWMRTKTTSQPSKNYYELSRQVNQANAKAQKKEKLDSQLVTGAPLVKTIKTIELDESGNDLKETKVQSFIDQQTNELYEKDRQLREATRVRSKPRPVSEMTNRNRSVKKENEVLKNGHNTKPDENHKKVQRPFSAPSWRKPTPAFKEKKQTHVAETRNQTVSTDVNDNIKQNGKSMKTIESIDEDRMASETDEEDKMSDLSFGQESGSENEADLKTSKDLEIEKIIERHLGKPSQTVNLSPPESLPSKPKSNKKHSKSSSEKLSLQKRSTAHSHGQCNCPKDSKEDSKKVSTQTVQLPNNDKLSNKIYGAFARGRSAPPLRTASKSKPAERPRTGKPVYITSKNPNDDFDTEENLECQQLQAKLAAKGVNVTAETLERALYPPSGRTCHYEVNATLPKNTSSNLLSHPKEWLPIEYRQLRLAERALNRANEIMYKQRVAEDRKARLGELAKKKIKGKKKGKTKGKKAEDSKI